MPPDNRTPDRRPEMGEWQERASRCRRLAGVLHAHEASGRLTALAQEIEEQSHNLARIAAIGEARRRHTAALLDAIEEIGGHIRIQFFFAQFLLRENSFTQEALREEIRACREEAKASLAGSELRLAFARQAAELTQFAAAIRRDDSDRGA